MNEASAGEGLVHGSASDLFGPECSSTCLGVFWVPSALGLAGHRRPRNVVSLLTAHVGVSPASAG